MKTLSIIAALTVAAAPLAQDDAPSAAPETSPAAPETSPASPATSPAGSAAPAAAPPAAPSKPFTLGRSGARPGKSPYATDTQFDRAPRVYVIPMEGLMGLDIHQSVYDRILKDFDEKKPDLVVFELKSSNHGEKETWMEAAGNEMDEDKVDPRRLASVVTEYRDMAANLRERLGGVPCVMYVRDARGVSCVYALAWPYMFISPDGKIAGLDVVTELAGGNDDDIRAKMLSAWTGIAKGILELGGHPQPLTDALVRPDRFLSADIDGRATKWFPDTVAERWIVVDSSKDAAARFPASLAEETGLAEGTAQDIPDLLGLLGYPEFEMVDSGQKIFRDTNAQWRKRFAESKKWMKDFQEPMDGPEDLGKRKAIIEKMLQNFKSSPQFARMWEWTRGLDETRLKSLLEELTEQIKANQKQRSGGGRRSGSGSGGGGGPGGPMGR
jgi:hypothetical protein